MYFVLGITTGILLLGFCEVVFCLIAFRIKDVVLRTFNQTESALKPKGSILEPQDNELEVLLDEFSDE